MIMLKKFNRNYTYPVATAGLLIVFISGAYAQIPTLNSNTAAKPTVYLDFDGQNVEGTVWNTDIDVIKAKPSGLSATAINEIFHRVAEDFTIFNLNITTDPTVYSKAPTAQRVRVIITPTSSWWDDAPGVSWVYSFTWGDDTPSWVFNDRLYNDNKYISEAVSHEIGHTLGLQHQSTYDKNCNKLLEYAEGRGTGETSWAPIMGYSYDKNITTWTTGTNSLGCNEIQNDIEVICNSSQVSLRKDDHGSTRADATVISATNKSFNSTGLINNAADKDIFKIVLNSNSVLKASAVPTHVATGNSGANLDIKMSLLRNSGDTISHYNPKNLLSAALDTNLKAGTYYLVIDGVSNQNLPEQGSIGYYTLSGSVDAVLPITKLTAKGVLQNNRHSINWTFEADEPVKEAIIESSGNGVQFVQLKTLSPAVTQYSYKPSGSGSIYYRIKMVAVQDEKPYYSNILVMQCPISEKAELLGNMVSSIAQVNVPGNYAYQLLDETGRLLQQGKLATGLNNVSVSSWKKGLLLLKVYNEKEQQVFRLIKR